MSNISERGADMPCPPPPPMILAHANFVKQARDAGLPIDPLVSDMSLMTCPPTPQMLMAFKALISQAVAKGIAKPDYADD